MPRIIAPIGQEPENEQITAKEGNSKKQEEEKVSLDAGVITAKELESLIAEFERQGRRDLIINPDLTRRMHEYLNQQEEQEPLMKKLAERLYMPYVADRVYTFCRKIAWMNVNGIKVAKVTLYEGGGDSNDFMSLSDFKKLVLYLKNPYAMWIPEKNVYVNASAYVQSQGGTFIYEMGRLTINI